MSIRSSKKNVIIGTIVVVAAVILFLMWFAPLLMNFANGHVQK